MAKIPRTRFLHLLLLSSNICSRCPHNMVNFGPLTAEIGPVVWGTPANFNGFRVLAALLHGTLVVGVSQTLRRGIGLQGMTLRNFRIGRHLYSAGWPSRWASADAHAMAALPNIGGALCSTPQSLADATTRVPCSIMLPI